VKWSYYRVFLRAVLKLTANLETYRGLLFISTKEVLQKLEHKNYSSLNKNEFNNLTSDSNMLYVGVIKIKI